MGEGGLILFPYSFLCIIPLCHIITYTLSKISHAKYMSQQYYLKVYAMYVSFEDISPSLVKFQHLHSKT